LRRIDEVCPDVLRRIRPAVPGGGVRHGPDGPAATVVVVQAARRRYIRSPYMDNPMSKNSQAAMAARIQELEAELARRDNLGDCQVTLADGITKKGIRYCHIQVKGGPFGWRGINLKPQSWDRLKSLTSEIDAAFVEHADALASFAASNR
jgi:hypothetical protein